MRITKAWASNKIILFLKHAIKRAISSKIKQYIVQNLLLHICQNWRAKEDVSPQNSKILVHTVLARIIRESFFSSV